MIRRALMAVEEWVWDDSIILFMAKASLVLGLILAPIFVVVLRVSATAEAGCLASGRAWAVVGQHRGMIWTGKVMVPHTVTDYGCVEWLRP